MYYPKLTAKPLEFGIAYHRAMQVLYDPVNRPDREDTEAAYALARVAFKQTCEEQRKTFISSFPERYTSEVDTDYAERVELGLGMLEFWRREVMPRYDHNFVPIKVEIPFEVAIGDLWCKCDICWMRWRGSDHGVQHHDKWQVELTQAYVDDGYDAEVARPYATSDDYYRKLAWGGLPVTYGGRIDMLAQDTNGDYWIVDWKTTSRMTNAEPDVADEFMLLDDQITSYCWAMSVIGIPVKGFIYVEIKKGFPQEPEPNKVQRLGRWFSVNKQQVTTYEIYRRTVEENDPAAYGSGLYDEFLDWLKANATLESFVHRHQITRTPTELKNAGINIMHEAREIIDLTMPLYPSPGRYGCNFCAFREPCVAKNRGEDFEYTLESLFEKRNRHYWETAPSTTDKRYS
jgi:hypothetical protein